MEIGNPQSLLTPASDELVFNDFSAVRTMLGGGSDLLAAAGLGIGNGYLLQKIQGGHGSIRNPVDKLPHKGGGIVHRFYREATVYSVEGIVIATSNANRTILTDLLAGAAEACLQKDGRHIFVPAGAAGRFHSVRLHDPPDFADDSLGIAAPRQFSLEFVAANPVALKLTQDSTAFASGATHTIPNDGNAATWPVFQISGPLSGATVTVESLTSGFQMNFANLTVASGHYAEVNMFDETVYLDGNSTNLLPAVVLGTSDFFSIAAGGESVRFTGAAGVVLSNSAWV